MICKYESILFIAQHEITKYHPLLCRALSELFYFVIYLSYCGHTMISKYKLVAALSSRKLNFVKAAQSVATTLDYS
ncbi:hypothetical protein BCM14_0761 [Jezberella montanilacus]|uniref:Uncharacterized protein n=1 Tax=Jezberella montanilacus TaxID=323426 RepID=A0A2T0XK85_9BURK|nr:hypothetical protein BCM14_0761 [Jezberella montanilacus]